VEEEKPVALGGKWGWAPRKRLRAPGGARIHLSNPAEIEKARKKIAEAVKRSRR
jgi:hypothetical protein